MRLALAFAFAVALVPTGASADPKSEAQHHIARAREAHAAGHYDAALKELTLAYALDPQPALLYAIAQVHVKLGDCASATTFYRRFLATHPAPNEVAVVDQAIAKCRSVEPGKPETLAPAKTDEVIEPTAPPPAAPPPAPAPPLHVAWYRDWIGDALVTGGIAVGAVAAFEYDVARSDRDRADTAPSYTAYASYINTSQHERDVSLAIAAGGAVLVTAGVVRYVLHARSADERTIAIELVNGRAFVAYRGRL